MQRMIRDRARALVLGVESDVELRFKSSPIGP